MTILGLETSSAYCSIALHHAGAITQRQQYRPRGQVEILLPMIDDLLTAQGLSVKDVDLFAFSAGPASFTGVRLAASVVQAFSLLGDRPVAAISSLQSQVQTLWQQQQDVIEVVVCNNAYMGEVYWAHYRMQEGVAQLQGQEQLLSPAALPIPSHAIWVATGDGWACHPEALKQQQAVQVIESYPQASAMLALASLQYQQGQCLSAEAIEARYLRKPDAWQTLAQQAARKECTRNNNLASD